MLPSVVIIGRPNVGKSTLFNRLTGRRSALVSDTPGLTRDRREGEAEIGGHPVTLIDTAGLEDAPSGSIAARMRAQTETAVREADVVLFVVDARAGVTPPDVEFARLARTTGKPVVLVANKSEGRAGAEGFYDSFQLGFGAPVAVSAEHGEGLADLESDILSALGLQAKIFKRRKGDDDQPAAEEAPSEASHPLRIAIVGRPNAGKSTLVNTILGQERMITGPEPGLTRDAVATDLDWQGRRMRLFDTAGLRRKARISETAEKLSASDAVRAIRFAEVVVLLIDAERPFEHQDLTIGDLVTEEGRALVVAVNKWDVVENKQKLLRDLKSTVAEKLSQVPDVALVPVSALSGRGVDKLMEAVIKAHAIWNTRVSTSDLNRWLREAMERHTPPAAKGRRIRIRFITQPSTRPPTFVAFCSQPAGLPKSYVRYLVNSLRDAFGLPGVPIRFSLRKGENPYVRS
ncbi:MAG TPA: ribosome biogenesis GTPase Der [Hyphomicrobiaceae bacterium]|nr:ribosome biogenesis GTPase Der [Hyphomicrobiaceae bacterium]